MRDPQRSEGNGTSTVLQIEHECTMKEKHQVVIVGGGFGGLSAARGLRDASMDVKLIDRRNFHLFQPLLYQVATGELSPANIASPLRSILRRQKNVQVLMEEVTGFDLKQKQVVTVGGPIRYDSLIVAAGATHSYFGRDDWVRVAPGLKTIEDATLIRQRILSAFEHAEREADPELRREWLTFVIVGAGPTGVELAGALSEVANYSLKHDFRNIDPSDAKIVLVEAGESALSMYPEKLRRNAHQDLRRLHVEVMTKTRVTEVTERAVQLSTAEKVWDLPTRTVVWAAGVAASPLGKMLAEQSGASIDRVGRIAVNPDCSVPNHPDVFVIGDLALYVQDGNRPLPGLAPVAMQQGDFVAQVIRARSKGNAPPPAFRYHDRGNMAVIGRCSAVAVVGKWQLSGFLAWFIWVAIHLIAIIQFRNRLIVMFQWAWTFLTRDRHARLITKQAPTA